MKVTRRAAITATAMAAVGLVLPTPAYAERKVGYVYHKIGYVVRPRPKGKRPLGVRVWMYADRPGEWWIVPEKACNRGGRQGPFPTCEMATARAKQILNEVAPIS